MPYTPPAASGSNAPPFGGVGGGNAAFNAPFNTPAFAGSAASGSALQPFNNAVVETTLSTGPPPFGGVGSGNAVISVSERPPFGGVVLGNALPPPPPALGALPDMRPAFSRVPSARRGGGGADTFDDINALTPCECWLWQCVV
jgi:hypothetical protein